MMKWKLSNSQNLVLQALVSIFFSVVIGAVTAGIQYIVENGHLDYKVLLSVVIAAFGALFAAALKEYVPSHALDLLQATRDTETQVQTAITPMAVVPIVPVRDSTPPVVQEKLPDAPQVPVPTSEVTQVPFPTTPPVASVNASTVSIGGQTFRVTLVPDVAAPPTIDDTTQKVGAVKAP